MGELNEGTIERSIEGAGDSVPGENVVEVSQGGQGGQPGRSAREVSQGGQPGRSAREVRRLGVCRSRSRMRMTLHIRLL